MDAFIRIICIASNIEDKAAMWLTLVIGVLSVSGLSHGVGSEARSNARPE